MPGGANDLDQGLSAARAGSARALGDVLEACRGYLLQVAQRELGADLQAKGGASDLVQQTMLDALGGFGAFHGGSEAELHAWLRRLLLNNLVSFTRLYREAGKRQIGREVRLDAAGSSNDLAASLAASTSSPSGQAVGREQAEAIQRARERLPEDYRRALQLRYDEGCTFEEIGRQMDLSTNAARKLWGRALQRLRQEVEQAP